MIPGLNIAVSGMLDAANRLNGAASSTVKKTTTATSVFSDPASTVDDAGTPRGSGSIATSTTSSLSRNMGGSPLYIPSYAEDAVQMREAVHAYKASAKMLRTAADIARELTEELGAVKDPQAKS